MGQIIGFAISLIFTALFVMIQQLTDRIPSRIGRRLAISAVQVSLLMFLLLLLIYDLVLFYLTREGYVPLAEAGLVVLLVITAIPATFYTMAHSISLLHPDRVINSLGKRSKAATKPFRPRALRQHLDALRTIMQFAAENGHVETSRNALHHLLNTASIRIKGRERTAGDLNEITKISDLLTEAPMAILNDALDQQKPLLFGTLLRTLLSALPEVPPYLRRRYRKKLVKKAASRRVIQDPGFGIQFALSVLELLLKASAIRSAAVLSAIMRTDLQLWGALTRTLKKQQGSLTRRQRLMFLTVRREVLRLHIRCGMAMLSASNTSIMILWEDDLDELLRSLPHVAQSDQHLVTVAVRTLLTTWDSARRDPPPSYRETVFRVLGKVLGWHQIDEQEREQVAGFLHRHFADSADGIMEPAVEMAIEIGRLDGLETALRAAERAGFMALEKRKDDNGCLAVRQLVRLARKLGMCAVPVDALLAEAGGRLPDSHEAVLLDARLVGEYMPG